MLINLKNNLHWLIYSTGLFVYFVLLAQTTFTLSVIWLLFVLYVWLMVSIITQQYCFKCLLYVFCSSGIIVAISLFFIYGVEQVPLPIGAVLFRSEGILPALLLLCVYYSEWRHRLWKQDSHQRCYRGFVTNHASNKSN